MLPYTRKRFLIYSGIGSILFIVLASSTLYLSRGSGQVKSAKTPPVALPTIYNGELLLPKLTEEGEKSNVGKVALSDRLSVVSANMIAVVEKDKLSGIRIIGEMENDGSREVTGISPVVRFYDSNDVLVGQKVARPSAEFDFKTVSVADKALYDVTIDAPPQSDKVEIRFNVTTSTSSAVYRPLLISNRNLETKTANATSQAQTGPETTGEDSTGSAGATLSAAPAALEQKVDYYVASGQINNPMENPVTDITIYAWAKDDRNKVFAFGRTDFKNDLVNPGEKIDFKVMILPVRSDQTYSTYEISAWGREYKLLN